MMLVNATLPPLHIAKDLGDFTGLFIFALGLIVALVVIGVGIFGPRDGICCELCGLCWIACYKECCKRRKHYAETLDRKIRDWKDGRGQESILVEPNELEEKS